MMNLFRLHVLRVLIICVISIVIFVNDIVGGKLNNLAWPMKWLRHYLIGSGTSVRVPDWIVLAAKDGFIEAINRANAIDTIAPILGNDDRLNRSYCLYHSTIYDGVGFWGRPILFYLLGGFTFHLYPEGVVAGRDEYDWHATRDYDGNAQYFTSSFGHNVLCVIMFRVLGFIFGSQYFVTDGFPSGSCGISNRLWEAMYEVGAKSFNSYFKTQLHISDKEYANMICIFQEGYEAVQILDCQDGNIYDGQEYLFPFVKEWEQDDYAEE